MKPPLLFPARCFRPICRKSTVGLLFFLALFASLRASDSEKEITVPGAQQAIERYDKIIAKAKTEYAEHGEQAREAWNERVRMRRATTAYETVIRDATDELTAELERIEIWLLDQVERIRDRRESATAEKETLVWPFIYGQLNVIVKGSADIYLNGDLAVAMTSPNETHHTTTDIRFRSGDLLLFRVQSPFTYRSFRALITMDDDIRIPVTTTNQLRFIGAVNLDPETITAEQFDDTWTPTAVGRPDPKMVERWQNLGFENDETAWIRIPDREGPYWYAFRIP